MTAADRPRPWASAQASSWSISTAGTGRTVEITHRGSNAWTVAGQPDDVRQAVALMMQAPGATLDDQQHDDELAETFAYITFPG